MAALACSVRMPSACDERRRATSGAAGVRMVARRFRPGAAPTSPHAYSPTVSAGVRPPCRGQPRGAGERARHGHRLQVRARRLHAAAGPISLAFNAALYRKLPYDTLRDFALISLVADQPNILVAHPSLPVKSPEKSSRSPARSPASSATAPPVSAPARTSRWSSCSCRRKSISCTCRIRAPRRR